MSGIFYTPWLVPVCSLAEAPANESWPRTRPSFGHFWLKNFQRTLPDDDTSPAQLLFGADAKLPELFFRGGNLPVQHVAAPPARKTLGKLLRAPHNIFVVLVHMYAGTRNPDDNTTKISGRTQCPTLLVRGEEPYSYDNENRIKIDAPREHPTATL